MSDVVCDVVSDVVAVEIIEMSAGAAPVEWEHWSLAPGMELAADLDERHAVLSGTPDIPGVYPFQLLAFDSRGDVASVELVLRVVGLLRVPERP